MLTLWTDFDRAFFRDPWQHQAERDLWRSFDRLVDDVRRGQEFGWPRSNLVDAGKELVFTAELPGVAEKDIEATVHKDVLTVRATRRIEPLAQARAHLQEREAYTYHRSFSLPVPVDAERTSATLKEGVLTIKMAIAPEHEPRRITVQS